MERPDDAARLERGSEARTDRAPAPSLRRWTLDRLRDLELRPSRDLGQNFIVEERFLDAVVEAAKLAPTDVVLEVGGGLGGLSQRLAPLAAHLHVVELDRRLAALLARDLESLGNATVHEADAVRLPFGDLRPAPTKLVANLPYGVAATTLLKAIEELAQATLLVGMVQLEVAERLAAAPGSRTYGATSVLAQLACEVWLARRVPRSVFHPAPNVDSAIVVLRRWRPSPSPAVRRVVRGAFAHRRKTLAGSLALAGVGGPGVRVRARAALAALGHPRDARAERLSPEELEQLAVMLELGVEPPP